jgi:hypothetical protein
MLSSGKQRLFRRGLTARACLGARVPTRGWGPCAVVTGPDPMANCFENRAGFGLSARAAESILVIPRVMERRVSRTESALCVHCLRFMSLLRILILAARALERGKLFLGDGARGP